ncbi:MAG: DUF6338 family protein [Pseudomonadota bacterium]
MQLPFTATTYEDWLRFILAGFIIWVVRNAYAQGERPKLAELALDIILLSVINQIVWQLLLWAGGGFLAAAQAASTKPEHFVGIDLSPQTLIVIEALILPTALGIGMGLALRSRRLEGLLRAMALPVTGPVRRSYDAVFGEIDVGVYVIVTLDDGTVIYGYYGPNSKAGRDAERSEIYLEEIYNLEDVTSDWESFDPPRSALIRLSSLRSVEFLNWKSGS